MDPFGSEISNKTVKADRIWTEADDGFAQNWPCRSMLINPPGGKVRAAWEKLVAEIRAGRTQSGVWVGFSVEQLCILADPPFPREGEGDRLERGAWWPGDFSVVMLRKRISFVKEDGSTGSPSHGNFLVAFGTDSLEVEEHFGHLGQIFHGYLSNPANMKAFSK